jgi:hypothetical protein
MGSATHQPDGAVLVAALLFGSLVTWSAGPWNLRYALYELGLICLVAALEWDTIFFRGAEWRRSPRSLAVLVVVCLLAMQAALFDYWGYQFFNRTPVAMPLPPWPVVLGVESRDHYLADAVSIYVPSMTVNRRVAANGCVLVYDPRTYYLEPDSVIIPGDLNLFAGRSSAHPSAPTPLEAWLDGRRRRIAPAHDGCTRFAPGTPLVVRAVAPGLGMYVVTPRAH